MQQTFAETSISNAHEGKKTVGMTLDGDSIKYVLGVLTNIYPNVDLAILREYSTNALDSHIEAGQTRPIEVTLPSQHDPHLRVQDWGIGMGEWELENIYGVYGKSTKRKSKKQLGAFGLGSKSALAAIDTLRVVSVRDGKRYNVIIDKDSEGVGQLHIRSVKDTDEPNGVTVIIPVNPDSIDSYSAQAEFLYQLWEPGTVLVNGRQPTYITERGYQKVGDLGYIAADSNSYRNEVRVNMGGILYKVDGLDYAKREQLFRNAKPLASKDVIITIPLDEPVELSPARESILSHEANLRRVRMGVTELYKYMLANAQREIEAAPNAFEAMKIMATFDFLGLGQFTYQGKQYEQFVKIKGMDSYKWESENGRRKHTTPNDGIVKLPVSASARKALVIDMAGATVDRQKVVSTLNTVRRMNSDMAVNHVFYVGKFAEPQEDIFVQAMIANSLIKVYKADQLMDEVAAFRKANRAKSSGGARGSITYPVYFHNGHEDDGVLKQMDREDMTIAELRELDHVYVHKLGTTTTSDLLPIRESFGKHGKSGEVLLTVSYNRSLETLEKRISKDVEVEPFADEFAKRIRTELVKPEASRLHHVIGNNYSTRSFFKAVSASGIEIQSPLFNEAMNYDPETAVGIIAENRKVGRVLNSIGKGLTDDEMGIYYATDTSASTATVDFWGHYGMARSMVDTWNPTEREGKYAAMTVNAIFAAEGDPVIS